MKNDRASKTSQVCLNVGASLLALVGFVDQSFAEPPRLAPSFPLRQIETAPQKSRAVVPPGPCSGGTRIIVGPGLGRTETTSPTIKLALDFASGRNVCIIELEVRPGVYGEPLTITRDTTITNSPPLDRPVVTGSITNNNRVLTMTGIILRNTPAPGAIVMNGGISILQNVTIEYAVERGIAVNSGILKITSGEIRNTRASISRQGAGIELYSGRALLDSVVLRDNVGWGIVASGTGTVVKARNVTVHGTTMVARTTPLPPRRNSKPAATRILRELPVYSTTGAIRVASGASLYADNITIDQNEFVGLLVDQGGQANVRNSTFAGTRSTGGDAGGGNNILATTGSTLDLLNFTSKDSDLSGLCVGGGWVKGKDGILTNNEFGLAIIRIADGWKRQNCFENTRAFDNRSQDLSADIDVPSYSDTSNNSPQGCRGVPVPAI